MMMMMMMVAVMMVAMILLLVSTMVQFLIEIMLSPCCHPSAGKPRLRCRCFHLETTWKGNYNREINENKSNRNSFVPQPQGGHRRSKGSLLPKHKIHFFSDGKSMVILIITMDRILHWQRVFQKFSKFMATPQLQSLVFGHHSSLSLVFWAWRDLDENDLWMNTQLT